MGKEGAQAFNNLAGEYGITVSEKCFLRVRPIDDTAVALHGIGILMLEPELGNKELKVRRALHLTKEQVNRERGTTNTTSKPVFEYAANVLSKTEAQFDKGEVDNAAEIAIEGSIWLGHLAMLESANCICEK